MSAKKTRPVISAIITLILFVVVPYLLPEYIPPDINRLIVESRIDLDWFLNEIMVVGAVSAVIKLVKGFAGKASPIWLFASLAQNVSSLVFTLILLGAGDILSLGVIELTIENENATNYIIMNMRVLVYLSIEVVVLSMIRSYLRWKEARVEAAPPGRIPA
jgi:Flp pilus assembly protein protease CpaA